MSESYVIEGGFADDLSAALAGCQKNVQERIAQGYIPVGGLVVFRTTDGKEFALQAVYKEPARVALAN